MFNFDTHQYEDVIELNIPVDYNLLSTVVYNWVQYNPRKMINRWGCSITSLDGEDSGIPDLDSLLELKNVHSEKDFNKPTKHSAPFTYFLNKFDVGRSHYIKLGTGGYFPWHRDADNDTFRIIYTIDNCGPRNLVWLEDDSIVKLENNKWYYINTKKKHAVFSFSDSIFTVFNVLLNRKNISVLKDHFLIK